MKQNEQLDFGQRVDYLRNDSTSGSSQLVAKALEILEDAVDLANGDLLFDSIAELTERLRNAQPAIAALQNIMQYILSEISSKSGKRKIKSTIIQIKNKVEKASEICINSAINIIYRHTSNPTIITCSYSSNVFKFIKKSYELGKSPFLFCLESSWKGIDYHKQLVDQCKDRSYQAQELMMNDLEKAILVSDFVLIGADIIFPSGRIVNGLPSFKLAFEVNRRIPFYVIAESFKSGSHIQLQDGYDYVPGTLISEIITDNLFYK